MGEQKLPTCTSESLQVESRAAPESVVCYIVPYSAAITVPVTKEEKTDKYDLSKVGSKLYKTF